jgi:hypothetical protein
MFNGPCRSGPAQARAWHEGYQSKLDMVILIWTVLGWRHDGPVVPGRARTRKKNTPKFRI